APASAGGGFAAEAKRLGVTTAELPEALAPASGRHEGEGGPGSGPMAAQVARATPRDPDRVAVAAALGRLRRLGVRGGPAWCPGARRRGTRCWPRSSSTRPCTSWPTRWPTVPIG